MTRRRILTDYELRLIRKFYRGARMTETERKALYGIKTHGRAGLPTIKEHLAILERFLRDYRPKVGRPKKG